MRDFYEYDDPNGELLRRIERDEEKEPRPSFSLPPRRRQFRYWSGLMFRPASAPPDHVEQIRRAS